MPPRGRGRKGISNAAGRGVPSNPVQLLGKRKAGELPGDDDFSIK